MGIYCPTKYRWIMTKEQIIKLYIADLNNLVADSDAKTNRIMDLEDELESIKQGQSLPIDSVVGQSEQYCNCDKPTLGNNVWSCGCGKPFKKKGK